MVYGKMYSRRVRVLDKTKNVSCVALAFCTRACALTAWTARLGGSHWRLLIDWLFMHDLEERCDVCASNIEFTRAAAGEHA